MGVKIEFAIDLGIVLTNLRRTTLIGNRLLAELGKRTGIGKRFAYLLMVDRGPVLTRLQLLALDDLVNRGDRSDEQATVQGVLKQLFLGFGLGEVFNDRLRRS